MAQRLVMVEMGIVPEDVMTGRINRRLNILIQSPESRMSKLFWVISRLPVPSQSQGLELGAVAMDHRIGLISPCNRAVFR